MTDTFAQALNKLLEPMLYNTYNQLLPVPGAALTYSGNEITDAIRVADGTWPVTQNIGSTDGLTPPAGLGVWRSSTNLAYRGQCDAISGAYGAGDAGTTLSIDTTTPAPFSPQSIKVVTDGSTSAQHASTAGGSSLNAPPGNIGLASLYFKGQAGKPYFASLFWANTDSTITGGVQNTFNATGQWQLIIIPPATVATGKTGGNLIPLIGVNATRADTFWIAHPMVENGTFSDSTPYIATSGLAYSTRLSARVKAPPSLLSATQGWFACRIRMGFANPNLPSSAGAYCFQLSDGGWNNRIMGYIGTNQFVSASANGGNANFAAVTANFNVGDYATLIFSWTPTQIRISVNGAPFAWNTRSYGVPPGMNTLDIANALSFAQLDGQMFWAATGTGVLTDNDAASLYQLGNTPPILFPDAAQVTSVNPLADNNVYNTVQSNDLTTYLDSIGDSLFQIVQDWSSDTDDVPSKPGYSLLVDASRVPDVAIPWLAQFVGSDVVIGVPASVQRTQLTGLGTWKRGTVAALKAAPVPYLTGSQTVIVKERDTGPYHLEVMTYANETPNQAAALAALLSQKPAGLVMTYVVFAGQKAFQVRGGSALRGTPADTLRLVV